MKEIDGVTVGWFVVGVLELASGLRSRNLRVVGCRAFTWNGIIYDYFIVDGEVPSGTGTGAPNLKKVCPGNISL